LILLEFVRLRDATEPFTRFGRERIRQAFSGMGRASQNWRVGVL
jgi:hypothetical protein